jgi:hypothetical protein
MVKIQQLYTQNASCAGPHSSHIRSAVLMRLPGNNSIRQRVAPYNTNQVSQRSKSDKNMVINIVLVPRHSTHFASLAVEVVAASSPWKVEAAEVLSFR